MTAFATSDDLAVRLGVTLDAVQQARADVLLAIASDLVRDATGVAADRQTISRVTDDAITMNGTTDEVVKLPQRPVVSVSSVALDNVTLVEGADWYLDGNAIRRIPSSTFALVTGGLADEAFAFPLATGFGWPAQTLEITYTHGYADADIPGLVKAITLEAVVRVWVNPGSVARQQFGHEMTVYDNMRFSPTGLLLTDDETKKIRRYFGRKAKSITVGE